MTKEVMNWRLPNKAGVTPENEPPKSLRRPLKKGISAKLWAVSHSQFFIRIHSISRKKRFIHVPMYGARPNFQKYVATAQSAVFWTMSWNILDDQKEFSHQINFLGRSQMIKNSKRTGWSWSVVKSKCVLKWKWKKLRLSKLQTHVKNESIS